MNNYRSKVRQACCTLVRKAIAETLRICESENILKMFINELKDECRAEGKEDVAVEMLKDNFTSLL